MRGLERVLQSGDFVAVTAFEFGELGGEGADDAAGLVGVGPVLPGRAGVVLLLGAKLLDALADAGLR